jgi:hypothetical protein
MKRLVILVALAAAARLVAKEWPDIQRYLRSERI